MSVSRTKVSRRRTRRRRSRSATGSGATRARRAAARGQVVRMVEFSWPRRPRRRSRPARDRNRPARRDASPARSARSTTPSRRAICTCRARQGAGVDVTLTGVGTVGRGTGMDNLDAYDGRARLSAGFARDTPPAPVDRVSADQVQRVVRASFGAFPRLRRASARAPRCADDRRALHHRARRTRRRRVRCRIHAPQSRRRGVRDARLRVAPLSTIGGER